MPTASGDGCSRPMPSGSRPRRGIICYDLSCPLCGMLVARTQRLLRPLGFRYAPLQAGWVQQRLSLHGVADEMKLICPDGSVFGGADALLAIAEALTWARPLAVGGRLPGIHAALAAAYRFVAEHRGCRHGMCRIDGKRQASAGASQLR